MKKNKHIHRANFPNTRKTLRKQKRKEKKVHRQEHYMKKKIAAEQPQYTPGRFVKRPADDLVSEVEPKKKKQKFQASSQDILTRERQKEKKEVARLNSQIEEQRKKMLLKANEDEDKMIKKLEKQLGLNKSKNKNNYFTEDGLDYLLEVCDRATSEQIVAAEKHLADVENESDFEDDLAKVTGKEIDKKDKNTSSKDKDGKKGGKSKITNNDSEEEDLDDEVSDVDDMEDVSDDDGSDIDEEAEGFESDDPESEIHEEESDLSVNDEKGQQAKSKSFAKKITNDKQQEKEKRSKERVVKAEDLHKVFSDDEVSHLSGDDEEEFSIDEINEGDKEILDNKSKEKPDVWEDIYGRKRDKEGNVIKEEKGIYIPPHLRNKDSTSDKDLVQLKRQIKSVLNKLSGSNLHWASNSIEAVYASHSRHAASAALCALWWGAAGGRSAAPDRLLAEHAALVAVLHANVGSEIAGTRRARRCARCGGGRRGGRSAAPDRLLAEHAALVAVLHANVGSEIGAYFLQELTKKLDELTATPQPVEDKTLDNLVSCLAYLYTFKIYQAPLLFDILDRVTASVSEKACECVAAALRAAGAPLRKEAPRLLAAFILRAQDAAGAAGGAEGHGSRMKFLLEMLQALKNNNLAKIPRYDPSHADHLQKLVRAAVRKGNYVTPLNIRLEDLLKAEERGKWWVVGSAWEGQRPAERPCSGPAPPQADAKLLELARAQRMNTDVRRSIFCVIMSAEDYLSAFEKLSGLGLRGQQREVAAVVLACCLRERTYNPYYGLLACKLPHADRKYQLSFQFAIWDKIKDLESLSQLEAGNLARLLVQMILDKGLPLSVLKIIQFSELTKRSVKFMRQILLSIIMNEDLETSLAAFHRIAKPQKLHMFRESLRLFIQHFLVKHAEKKNNVLSEKEMAILKERASNIDKILTQYESKVMF